MLALITACATADAPRKAAPSAAPGDMRSVAHAGRWTTDVDGRALTFHGVNMVAKRAPYIPAALGFGEDDAKFLAANGFNAVRLGVIYKAVEPLPGVYDDNYLRQLQITVSILARHGVRSLLDFHQDLYNEAFAGEGFPDWAVPAQFRGPFASDTARQAALRETLDQFWSGARRPDGVTLQDRYVTAVGHVATFFASDRGVLGYDLMNEPPIGGLWPECVALVDCSRFDAILGAFQQRIVAAIRRVDRTRLAFYEPNALFAWGVPAGLPRFDDRQAGMSFHNYCVPGLACDPNLPLENADHRSATTGDALLLTEFGGEYLDDIMKAIVGADAHLMSWMVWAYCGCGDPTGSTPPEAEGLVKDVTQTPAGANVDAQKLPALVRPYPQVVAGTPTQLRFDPQSKTFTLTYSTRRPDGTGSFGSGACTRVFVPQLHYPTGYNVDVKGATVVSRRGSGSLLLSGSRGAGEVTVRITPTTRGRTDAPDPTAECAATP
jgi:endoglycosylceramidase